MRILRSPASSSKSARRVQGLRREEVAQLVAISTDYAIGTGTSAVSGAVPETLAHVLRLDDDQRTYLYQLAGKHANAWAGPPKGSISKAKATEAVEGAGNGPGSTHPRHWVTFISLTKKAN